jgi:hypothetical protein
MQPFPIPVEPRELEPCRTLRSRREVNTKDTVNSRFVEQWMTDTQQPFYTGTPLRTLYVEDMMPTSARTYAPAMNQWHAYAQPPSQKALVEETMKATELYTAALDTIQRIDETLAGLSARDPSRADWTAKRFVAQKEAEAAQTALASIQTEALSENPYFTQYDVASDPRNIVRELRSVVVEDKVAERGINESQRFIQHDFQTRWAPLDSSKAYDTLQSYDMLRPAFTAMEKNYRTPN